MKGEMHCKKKKKEETEERLCVKPLWLNKVTLSWGLREANAEPGARDRQRGLWVRWSDKDRQWRERERDKAGERRENGKDLFQETVTILHYEWGEIYLSPAVRSGRRAGRGASLNATSEVYLCKLLPQEGVEWQLDVTLSLAYPGSSPGPAQWVQYSLCHRDCVTRHGWPFAFSRYLVATVNYNFPFAASPAVSLLAAAFQISLMGCEISFISAHNRASEQFWTI